MWLHLLLTKMNKTIATRIQKKNTNCNNKEEEEEKNELHAKKELNTSSSSGNSSRYTCMKESQVLKTIMQFYKRIQ